MNYYNQNLTLLMEKEIELAKRLEEVTPNLNVTLPKSLSIDYSELKDSGVLVILGFGLGDHVKELIDKVDGRTIILIIDPDINTFKTAMIYRDLTSILSNKRISLAISEDPTYATMFRLDRMHYVHKLREDLSMKIIENEIFTKKFPKYYGEVKENLRQAAVFATRSFATSLYLATHWQRNFLGNIVAFVKYPRIERLYGRFKDCPAILVNPGPSLDKNIEDLKQAKGVSLIIAVDTAFPILLNYKIEPDLVVSVDWTKANYDHCFRGLNGTSATLLADLTTYPKIISNFPNKIFIFSWGLQLIKHLGGFVNFECFTPPFRGSTSHCVFNLARLFGCNPIIFVGQDLSYPEGKRYGKGVPQDKLDRVEKEIKKQEMVWIDDIYGGKVITTRQMYNFLKWFEVVIKFTKDKITYIDATEGGAKIEGTEIMSLKEAIDNYCKVPIDVRGILERAREDYRIPDLSRLMNGLKELVKEWIEIGEISQKGKKSAENFLLEDKASEASLHELNLISQEILTHPLFKKIGNFIIEPLFFKMERRLKKVEDQKRRESIVLNKIKIYKTFFNRVIKLSRSSTLQIKGAEKRLNTLKCLRI